MLVVMKKIIAIVFLFFWGLALFAEKPLLERLQPTGLVNDFAHIISSQDKSKIEALLFDLRRKTGAEVIVCLKNGELVKKEKIMGCFF